VRPDPDPGHAYLLSPDDPPSKREILRAALRLFVREGWEETSVRRIARESGYTNPALFKFFESKQALALYLFERCYLRLFDRVDAAIRPGRPFRANLEAVLATFAEILDGEREAFLFVQDHLREFWPRMPLRVRRKSVLRRVRWLLRQGAREEAVRTRVSLGVLTAVFTGTLAQFARMSYFGEFKGPARRWTGQLERAMASMLGSSRRRRKGGARGSMKEES